MSRTHVDNDKKALSLPPSLLVRAGPQGTPVSLGFTRNRRQTFSVTLLRDGDPLIEATQMLDLASSGGGGVYSSPGDPVEGPRAPTVKIGASSPPSFRSTSSAGSVRGRASWAAPFQFSLSPAAAARSTRSESPTIQVDLLSYSLLLMFVFLVLSVPRALAASTDLLLPDALHVIADDRSSMERIVIKDR